MTADSTWTLVSRGTQFDVPAVLGAKGWRANQLTPAAKRLLIISVVFLIVFFIVGWKSDLSLK